MSPNNVAAHQTGLFTEKVKLITQQGNEVFGWCNPEDFADRPDAVVQWSERLFKRSEAAGSMATFGEIVPAKDARSPAAEVALVVPPPPAASSTSSAPVAAGTGTTPDGQSQGQPNTPPPALPTSSDGPAKTDASGSATPT